jgi:hypothetical protein
MALRWSPAGMAEASNQFRHVNGHAPGCSWRTLGEHLAAETVGAIRHDEP